MSRPLLDSTPLGTNTKKITTSPIDSIPVGIETPDPMQMTGPTGLTEKNGKLHVPGELDPHPSSSDSSPKKSNSLKDRNSSKFIKKKSDKKKKRRKHKKHDASDSSSRNSESSGDSDYRHKQGKRESHQKTFTIKLCAHLTTRLPRTAYKSKIIRFKMDKDPLNRRIYFLTFLE